VATLEQLGWIAGAHWTPELGFDSNRDQAIVPLDPQAMPLRHDSKASLRGFVLVQADPASARPLGDQAIRGFTQVEAHVGDEITGSASGLEVARVFWARTPNLSSTAGASTRWVSHKSSPIRRPSGRYCTAIKCRLEGLRSPVDEAVLAAFVEQVRTGFADHEGRGVGMRHSSCATSSKAAAVALASPVMMLGADIIAAAASDPTFAPQLRRLARFWSPAALATLFEDVRQKLLSQHPLMTATRVARAATKLATTSSIRC